MENLDVVYINLDRSNERRERMEEKLKQHFDVSEYTRFAAIQGDDRLSGISKQELGCFLSHQQVIQSSSDLKYTLILEDDIIFPAAFKNKVLLSLDALKFVDWDILFFSQVTDIGDLKSTYKLLKQYIEIKNKSLDVFKIKSCKSYYVSGMVAYVVNPQKKSKICIELERYVSLNYPRPIDICILNLINKSSLNCYFTFPYLVGVETLGDSTIQSDRIQKSMLMEDMMNLFFIDSNSLNLLERYKPSAQQIEAYPEEFIASQIIFQRMLM